MRHPGLLLAGVLVVPDVSATLRAPANGESFLDGRVVVALVRGVALGFFGAFVLRLAAFGVERQDDVTRVPAHFRGAHAAFEAAHALKGVLGNLSLTSIYAPIVEITELLRNNTDMDYTSLLSNILEKKDELGRLCAD